MFRESEVREASNVPGARSSELRVCSLAPVAECIAQPETGIGHPPSGPWMSALRLLEWIAKSQRQDEEAPRDRCLAHDAVCRVRRVPVS